MFKHVSAIYGASNKDSNGVEPLTDNTTLPDEDGLPEDDYLDEGSMTDSDEDASTSDGESYTGLFIDNPRGSTNLRKVRRLNMNALGSKSCSAFVVKKVTDLR